MYVQVATEAFRKAVASLEDISGAGSGGGELRLTTSGRRLVLALDANETSIRVRLDARVLRRGTVVARLDAFKRALADQQGQSVILHSDKGGGLEMLSANASGQIDARAGARMAMMELDLERHAKAIEQATLALLGLLAALCAIIMLPHLVRNLVNELQPIYNCDSNFYFGIGRAIANGYRLYADMFDIKPPAIYYMSALSFRLTGDFHLTNYFCFAALCAIGLVPLLSAARDLRGKRCGRASKGLLLLSAAILGSLFTLFCHVSAGHVQVETFGACFGCLYLLMIAAMPTERMKPYSPRLLLTAVVLMLSPMFKEPFVLACLAAALLFVRNRRDFVYRLFLPMLYGGLLGALLMLLSGDLGNYLNLYLRYMLDTMIGNPLERMFNFKPVVDNLTHFSPVFTALIGALLLGAALGIAREVASRPNTLEQLLPRLLDCVKLPLGCVLTTMAVNTTGAVFLHHFVFAVPFYVGLMVYNIEWISRRLDEPRTRLRSGLAGLGVGAVLAAAALGFYPVINLYDTSMVPDSPEMRAEAAYIDGALDALGESRYQYFGFNGRCVNAYTEHIPLGPVFAQDWTKIGEGTRLGEMLLEQLAQSRVAVVQSLNCGNLTETVEHILRTQFTEAPPEGVEPPPEGFECRVFYRVAEVPSAGMG